MQVVQRVCVRGHVCVCVERCAIYGVQWHRGKAKVAPRPKRRTSPTLLATTTTRRRLAGDRVLHLALTLVRAVVSEGSRLAFLIAALARPAGCTGAAATDGIAGGIVLALAGVATPVAIMIEITGSITLVVAPARRTQALSRLRSAFGSVLAVAREGTILSVAACRTALLALFALEARITQAGSIDVRALGSIAAVAVQLTIDAVLEEGAGSRAQIAAPANAALASTRLRVTQISVFHIALAGLVAVQSVLVHRAYAPLAAFSLPSGGAHALARATACRIVLAVASLGAVQAVRVQRTLIHADLTHEAGRALAASGDVVAGGIIEAMALLLAFLAMTSGWALVGAHVARPAGCALAGSVMRIASSVVLAATVLLALHTVFPIRAAHVASDWKYSISRRALRGKGVGRRRR